MRLRVGDTVQVMSGADRGKQGKVLRLLDGGRVLVEGVNIRWKHAKPSQKQPRGGRIRKEAAVQASKVMPLDPESGKPTRVGHAEVDGKKVRVAKRSGKPIPFPERG
jgi:large subunit ribosomal protein L24